MKKFVLLLLAVLLVCSLTGCELSTEALVPAEEELTYEEINVGFEAAEDSVISGTYYMVMTNSGNYQSEHTAFIVQNGTDIVLCFSTSADKAQFVGTYDEAAGTAEMKGTADPAIVYTLTFYPDKDPVEARGEVNRDGADYCNIVMTLES